MSTNVEQSTDLIKIEEVKSIVATAPKLLEENQTSHDKALAYGRQLIESAKKGMTDDIDKLMATYIDKLSTTHKTMNERRKGFTSIVDILKKKFTSLEADLKPGAEVPKTIISYRNAYVQAKIDKKKKEDEAKQKALEKDMEVVQIKADCEAYYHQQFANYLYFCKGELNGILSSATSATIGKVDTDILGFCEDYPNEIFLMIDFNAAKKTYKYHDQKEVYAIIAKDVDMDKLFAEFTESFKSEIKVNKKEVQDKINSKRLQLEEMEKAKTAEAKAKLEAAEAKRKAEEQAELDRQRKAQEIKDKEKVDVIAAGEKAKAMTAVSAELFTNVESKKVYEITVLENSGYVSLFQFWFEKEGKGWTKEKFEKMTVGRMVKFAEGKAGDSQIQSEYLKYTEKHIAR